MIEEEVVQETHEETTQPEQPTQQDKDTVKEHNFRVMRERAEAAERRAYELERNQASQQRQGQPVDEDDLDLADDTLIEGKVFKKNHRDFKKAHKQTAAELAEMRGMVAEMKLRSKFSDFDAIVTQENLARLERNKPSHYRSIIANPNLYDRGEVAYEAIKSTLHSDKYVVQERKIEDSKNRPKSVSTVAPQASNSPLSRVGDYDRRILTEERKAELRRMVEETRKYG